jgi:hypothetical protein
MSAITINDLPTNLALDRKALAALRGGGAPWVFGWITPYAPQTPGFTPMVNNFFQTNNYIGQLVDQSQTIAIGNSGDGATITAVMIGAQGNAGL